MFRLYNCTYILTETVIIIKRYYSKEIDSSIMLAFVHDITLQFATQSRIADYSTMV